jgi:hypothetical protein
MPTLSSILVQRGAASMRAVEDAIARQLFHGGDLATNLLELGAVHEQVLTPILAELSGCPAAPVGVLRAPAPEVLRLLSADLALHHAVCPLERQEQLLVLAAAERLPEAVVDDLRLALGLSIGQVIAPLVRIRQAISASYGLPLEPRYARLASRLDSGIDPSPTLPAPTESAMLTVNMPRPVSVPSPTFGTGIASERKHAARVDAPSGSASEVAVARTDPLTRHKGPLTVSGAERELEGAVAPDQVLRVLFIFARQFFEYSALFVLHGDVAEGRDASGPGAAREKVAALRVRLDSPGLLSRIRQGGAPLVAPLTDAGLDAELARDLGRAVHKLAVALLPVVVRDRVVAVLYGDDGDHAVALPDLGDLLAVIGLSAAALERIAIQKKRSTVPEVAMSASRSAPREGFDAGSSNLARNRPSAGPALGTSVDGVALVRALEVQPGRSPLTAEGEPESRRITARTPPAGPEGASHISVDTAHRDSVRSSVPTGPRSQEVAGPSPMVAPEGSSRPPVATELLEPDPRNRRALGSREVTPPGTRRGQAPDFAGPSPSSRAAPPIGFEPLPRTPPSNATAFNEGASSWRSGPPDGPAQTGRSDASDRRGDTPIRDLEPLERAPKPSASRAPAGPSLDGGAGYAELIERIIAAGPDFDAAFRELVRGGEHVIQPIMARFPGPLRVDRHRTRAELPVASQCGPLLELVVALRRPALPFVSVRTSSTDVDIRFWATHVLGELLFPESANVLVPRLFDDDVSVRQVARQSAAALVNAGPPGAPILKSLDHIARSQDNPVTTRLLAIEAVAEVRAKTMVPGLIAVLEDSSDAVVEAARRALLLIARQDHGRDPVRWTAWWEANGGRHRVEWLIDALMHDQPAIRRAAGDELKLITREYFGYYDDLPKRERERAQALYRAWWEHEGRRRY